MHWQLQREDRIPVEGRPLAPGSERANGSEAGPESTDFDEIYATYRPVVQAFLGRRLGDATEVEDVTQEVFLQVYRSLARFEGRSSLGCWILGIAHRKLCRHYRWRRRRLAPCDLGLPADLQDEGTEPDRRVESQRLLERCSRAMQTALTPRQRLVFRLHFAENQSTPVIAERLGTSPPSVRCVLARGRRVLRREMPGLEAVLEI